jgi:hypothetical protein
MLAGANRSAVCRHAECHFDKWSHAQCCNTACPYAEYRYAGCRCAVQYSQLLLWTEINLIFQLTSVFLCLCSNLLNTTNVIPGNTN